MIYLDNAATTKPYEEVVQDTLKNMQDNYFNPSSNHQMGLEIDKKINTAKETLLGCLNTKGDIIFTSGGTEANNLAVLAKGKKHVITTKSEHPSVATPLVQLKNAGTKISYVNLDDNGQVDKTHLTDLLSEGDVSLVSIMEVNNELGTTQDIRTLGQLIKQNSKALFHVDGVAAFGKKKMTLDEVDMYTFSSHKIHGPQAVGALYVRKGVNLRPMLFGGDQQNKVRPGTENRIGILGFAKAAEIAYSRLEQNATHVEALKEQLLGVTQQIDNVVVNAGQSPYLLNLSFVGLKAQVLVNVLSENDIFVSTGAACSGKSNWNVLQALGKAQSIYDSAIRFSFSEFNTRDEIDIVCDKLRTFVKMLRITK